MIDDGKKVCGMITSRRFVGLIVVVCAACSPAGDVQPRGSEAMPHSQAATTAPATPSPSATSKTDDVRPDWLGTRVLREDENGLGEVLPTPPELVDRRFPPPDARPVADGFAATIDEIPADVLARSTWTDDCPVIVADLRYLTLTFWGFDGRTYVGEMIVNATVADDVVEVFQRLYAQRFPIEEMRVVASKELDAPPTGDGNNTTAFVCRPATLGDNWSQHAYGLAVDVNPFHNPYQRGDVVLPELASAYLDRGRVLPGVIQPDGAVVQAFASIGWGWGGEWNNLKDWMHFSQNGR